MSKCRGHSTSYESILGSSQSQNVARVGEKQENSMGKPLRKQNNDQNDRNALSRQQKTNKQACQYCGGEHAAQREKCPAWRKECLGCRSKNHFKKVCKNMKRRVHGVGDLQASDESEVEYLAVISVVPTDVKIVNAVDTHAGYDK